ncbi:glycosyltransferase [Spirosoma endbachense]|uniref:Glycosyltransferase n=1 Tax=Spirosoma endbachense TaxID=2666025 RepID=A0A6P1VV66_9BACT|nr:glycosyltransferase family 4 protein [Spirosoma endbachense]QHV95266.1 hypothetical protein GJR95_09680 [Spirosoma endbachense]
MRVYIDPQTDTDYTAFYIKGLYDRFRKANVSFSGQYFTGLKPNRTLKFILDDNGVIYKYVIDWGDDPSVAEADYAWCDYYGKINFNTKHTQPAYHPKIISLAPGFGIKLWSHSGSAYYGLSNLFKARRDVSNVKKFLSNYYKQAKQLPLNAYKPLKTSTNYVYSLNTLWNSDEWINNDATVNRYRANFMKACKSIPALQFEGGFVYSQIKNTNPEFQTLVIDADWIPKSTYINKIKASVLVFNTPAWALCHGWKLGEYLALGKAIISTPLSNELPAPLEHGKHIHIVSGEEAAIREAITLLFNNPDYRAVLEKNAYDYYCEYVSPIQSIKLLTQTDHINLVVDSSYTLK